MNKSRFTILMVVIFVLSSLVVGLVSQRVIQSHHRLLHELIISQLEQEKELFQVVYRNALDKLEQIASIYAGDPLVQELFFLGREAVEAENGGKGGVQAKRYRDRLYQHVGVEWTSLMEKYDLRQLHFHIPPVDTSFLRVHRPDKFGDDLSGVRPAIVYALQSQSIVKAFEVGRVVTGLRGIVPVYYGRNSPSEAFVGVVEAGMSFSAIIDSILRERSHHDLKIVPQVTVFLHRDYLEKKLWSKNMQELVKEHTIFDEYFVEATSNHDLLVELIKSAHFVQGIHSNRTAILDDAIKPIAYSSMPLQEIANPQTGQMNDAGHIVFWSDLSVHKSEMEDYLHKVTVVAFVFEVVLMLATFLLIRYLVNHYQKVLELQAFKARNLEQGIQAANEANQMKSAFIANISHELRTPMHSILSFTNLALKKTADVKLLHYLENIKISGKRLTGLLNNLLDLSSLEAGRTQMQIDRQDLCGILRSVLNEMDGLIVTGNIHVDFQSVQPCEAEIDGKLIHQVLVNILANALKFTGPGGHIDIRIESRPLDDGKQTPALEIVITDNGIGVPVNELEYIFDKFTQSRNTYSGSGGTGLGLAISKEIILRHQGMIYAISPVADDGKGTAIHIKLPLSQSVAG